MITPILVVIEVCIQEIGEEKQLQYGEHDKQLDENDDPQSFPYRAEVSETVVIEMKYSCKDVSLQNLNF